MSTIDGREWLVRAATGGLPEPERERWQPLRIGIVNLWEYDKAEFWFADGRLVLRGGNGAGKTKVLELTTLMLLRGEIAPSVLDPFGSQHRTMRYNLLPSGEADDPRPPAEAGLGYAWAEFGRKDQEGNARYFVCGLGASARRGSGTSGVTTWQFVTGLRPNKELELSPAGRPLSREELSKAAGVEVMQKAARYRERLAAELFGMDSPEAYDNLTELLKQLRRPKLGERLNPASLAETLREALPRLPATEVERLAEGWDNLEKLRRAVDSAKSAAKDVASFVSYAWLPWVRTVVRSRADALAHARTKLDETTKAKNAAEVQLTSARAQLTKVEHDLGRMKQERSDTDVELRELLESRVYQDAARANERIFHLRQGLDALNRQHDEADRDVAGKRDELRRQEAATAAARAHSERAESAVDAYARSVVEAAVQAGLASSAERSLPDRDVAALQTDLTRRWDRFRRLRVLERDHAKAKQDLDMAARVLQDREAEGDRARQEEDEAKHAVADAVADLQQAIREWARSTSVIPCFDEVVEHWCDLAVALTERTASPLDAIRGHAERCKDELREQRNAMWRRRDPLTHERQRCAAKLRAIKECKELPPPEPHLWRRADRPDHDAQAGAPLWQCVQPAAGFAGTELDKLEAAMSASGLLDAWISPDGRLRTQDGAVVADTMLVCDTGGNGDSDGASLAKVLEPTPVGGVEESIIVAALRGIGWYPKLPDDPAGTVWLAADGTWRLAALSGRAEPSQPASYLGATARAEARRREIRSLEDRVADLALQIADLDHELAAVAGQLSTVDEELTRLPRERPVTEAMTRWEERTRRSAQAVENLGKAQEEYRTREERQQAAWAEFAAFAAEYGFPLHDLDGLEAALGHYREALTSLEQAVHRAKHTVGTLEVAEEHLQYQATLVADAEAGLARLVDQVRSAQVQLATAERVLTTGHAEQLELRNQLDSKLSGLKELIDDLEERRGIAQRNEGKAVEQLSQHETQRADAEEMRNAALAKWWELYDAQLAQAVGLTEPQRRTVEAGRIAVAQARKELDAVAEGAEARALTRCTERLHILQQGLLPHRNAQIDSETEEGIPRFLISVNSESGWQLPNAASTALAAQVMELEEQFAIEQQEVLTKLLSSTFIEQLKIKLDETKRTLTGINDQLTMHATRYGNAVRIKYEPDPSDPHAAAVVNALNQGYEQLNPARQEMIRNFLARRIDEARTEADAAGAADWKDQLATALDYRQWLRISLEYRPGRLAQWRPFDRAQHGAKSGGEKVVLLSQPLFAAAVVTFESAGERAPRWVWLDEAMTGVDGQYKSSFMGLTVEFDLDVMLTAHDEWCTYATVPAVAIYDLARDKHLPGVDTQPHLWCGGDLQQVEMAHAEPRRPTADGNLFDQQDEP